jgi:hypothetical protein
MLVRAADYDLSPADAAAAAKAFYTLGSQLYDELIYKGDTALADVFSRIEAYGSERKRQGRPLRISIITSGGSYVPWQILHTVTHPPAAVDPEEFWGHKFLLSVFPLTVNVCGRLPATGQPMAQPQAMYLQYRNPANAGDPVAQLSGFFGDLLRMKFSGAEMTAATTRNAVETALRTRRANITLVWGFTHGYSGIQFETSGGTYNVRYEVNGPRLGLSDEEQLRSQDLRDWGVGFTAAAPFLAARPIVFLNGCETGTVGGPDGLNGSPFQDVFLQNGARAVIVTESAIWHYFGYGFGSQFLEYMARDGYDAARAIYEARLEFLRTNKNPFGLLYSVYGNGRARL